MATFNKTTRKPELAEEKSPRLSSKKAQQRAHCMRRIEAIKELKALGFTDDEISEQLDQD
jgi:Holliday junction resolvasome RuvABC DNA-binding subunit